ncbi:hypothetical protein VdG1_01310 [Verticillium dahliae VDG1]|nr:hypothetical protein VdG1_01310 [Verticillium dahliae VDG1]
MAYPPPPGISNASSNSSHPSLPARPPPSASASSGGSGSGGGFKSSFKPAFTPAQSSYSSAPSYGAGSAPAAGQRSHNRTGTPSSRSNRAAAAPTNKAPTARQRAQHPMAPAPRSWDPSHLRLFVGNLAGEVTDESLLKAFARWPSVAKARVVRDKRTSKSKGFGFVAFSDADDFFQAAKEMNGKYIQSHPVVVRKANTEIKVTNVKEKGRGKHGKDHKNKNRGGSGSGVGSRQEGGGDATLGPVHHGGVSKPGQKTKNGLRLLG